ncbi:MAG: hypothetical protein MZV64_60000 [Ignavibacteriales bacterium]|nr:hypothetical protein [Ignavibacteriales bacterium]
MTIGHRVVFVAGLGRVKVVPSNVNRWDGSSSGMKIQSPALISSSCLTPWNSSPG